MCRGLAIGGVYCLLVGGAAFAEGIFAEGRADFVFQVEDAHQGHATGEVLRDFAATAGLGDVIATAFINGRNCLVARDGRPVSMIAEWGYSGIRLRADEVDGAGLPRKGFPCFSSLQGCDDPCTKREAFERIQAYFEARREAQQLPNSWLFSMNGHYYFHHYAAAFGADVLLSEIGENINGTQAHVAFTRGAARQYTKPWGMDVSAWYGPGINDYWAEDDRVWCQERDGDGRCIAWYSGPDHGHSISLFERMYYSSYLSGAQLLVAEAGSVYFLNSRHAPPSLSPLGEMAREFYAFTQQYPDRGTPYVPVAMLLEYYHGLGLGSWYLPEGTARCWDWVPMGESERETLQLLEAIWPGAFEVMGRDESQYLVPTPMGDTVDVLLEDASLETLQGYEVLIFSGEIAWNEELKQRIRACLEAGKTVVFGASAAHAAMVEDLEPGASAPFRDLDRGAALSFPVAAGQVVHVQEPGAWPAVLQALAAQWPVEVRGDVQYLINRRAASWVVTLINNQGITKQPREAAQVDPTKRVEVRVRSRTAPLTSHEVWKSRGGVRREGDWLHLTLEPGEVAVVALQL